MAALVKQPCWPSLRTNVAAVLRVHLGAGRAVPATGDRGPRQAEDAAPAAAGARPRQFALVCGLCTLVLCLAKAALWPDLPLHHDQAEYHGGAVSILQGEGYVQYWDRSKPDHAYFGTTRLRAFFPVAYSLFLAGLYAVTGPRRRALRAPGAHDADERDRLLRALVHRLGARRDSACLRGLVARVACGRCGTGAGPSGPRHVDRRSGRAVHCLRSAWPRLAPRGGRGPRGGSGLAARRCTVDGSQLAAVRAIRADLD